MMQKQRIAFAFTAAVSLLITVGLALNASPWLRGDSDWRWPYFPLELSGGFWLAALALAVYVLVAWRIAQRGSEKIALFWAYLALILLPLILQGVHQADWLSGIFLNTTDPFLGGYLDVAIHSAETTRFLRDFPLNAPNWTPHPQRHPPGIILIYKGLISTFSSTPAAATTVAQSLNKYRCEYWPLLYNSDAQFAAATGALVLLALNVLAIFPFRGLARRLYPQGNIAPLLLLYPLIPAVLLWATQWDAALPFFTLLGIWLVAVAFERDRLWLWFVAGVVFSVGTFLTYATLIAVGVAGIFVLFLLIAQRERWLPNWRRVLAFGTTFLVGLSSLWLIYRLWLGVSFFAVYRANTAPHFEMESNYWLRLFYNPYDFWLFMGFPLALLTVYGVGVVLRRGRDSAPSSGSGRGETTPSTQFTLALWLTLIILVGSGISRAEVGRVWLFLMPLFLLTIGRITPAVKRYWPLVGALLALQILVMQATLMERVIFPRSAEMPSDAIALNMPIGDDLQLAGWRIDKTTVSPADALNVELFWQANASATGNFTRFIHVYNQASGVVAQNDSQPRNGQYPTSCWQTNEIVRETVTVSIAPEVSADTYQLYVGLYDTFNNNVRLQTRSTSPIENTILLTDQLTVSENAP